MAINSLTIKLEETRPGLFRICLTIPYDRKLGIYKQGEFKLCGSEPGVSGRKYSITYSLNSVAVNSLHFTLTMDEISSNEGSSGHEVNAGRSTSHEDRPKRPKVENAQELVPGILRPVYIWMQHYRNYYDLKVSNPLQFIETNSGQWQADYKNYSDNWGSVQIWMDFGINTATKKIVTGLSTLFQNQTFCDVQFRLKDGQSVGAHVAILSAGSPVFTTMFQSNFVESITRQVNINNIEPQVFKQLLSFLYNGGVPKLTEVKSIQSLLEAADMYDVEALKDECVNMLQTIQNTDNVIEILIWAYFFPNQKLLDAATQFVVKNSLHIFSQPEWMELVKDYPELCVKVNQSMAVTMQSNTGN
jgi:speckle-type POZ protein